MCVYIQETSAAVIVPDEWFHSWDAQNIRKAPGTCSFPGVFIPYPSFSPAVWFYMPNTFYGIMRKASLCSLLVYASRSLLQKHMRNVGIHILFGSILSSIQNPCPISSITIPSNCNRLLGKFKVLLMKLEYSLRKWQRVSAQADVLERKKKNDKKQANKKTT